jgi:arylsulfatase A-like enzyme
LALAGCGERPVPARDAVAAIEPGTSILLIVVDTLRPDWTTPYGFERDTTPHLARWAEQGVVFEHVTAQSSWTKMSMASLMTSLWPRSHAIREHDDGLAEGALTLAEVLADAGYHTYGVQTNGWLHQSFGFHQGFERYVFPIGTGGKLPQSNVWPHADRIVNETRRLLDAHPEGEPFFLYLHFMDVHEFAAPREFQTFGTDSEGAYQSSIRWVDDGLSRVEALLEERGLLDRTLIAFGSDHGEAFGENGKIGHARNVLSAVLRVPLVLRLPRAIEPVRVASPARNLDIAPTLLDLVGVPIPDTFEGRTLVPQIVGAEEGGDAPNFAALGAPLYPDASIQHSLRVGDWTYARNIEPDDPAEFLYDRSIDPREDVDLAAREPTELARMRDQLDAHLAGGSREEVLETGVRIDPKIEQRLRAMGYLQ